MARNWENLSAAYRHRLEINGVDKESYESGANLSEARGHGPRREDLIDQIQEYKIDLYGDKPRFNVGRSRKNIDRDTETGHKRTVTELKEILNIYSRINGIGGEEYYDGRDDLYAALVESGLEDADKYH